MKKCNQISIDYNGFIDRLLDYYIGYMERAEDKLIELMQSEIQKTTKGGAPGKPSWRNQISSMLKEQYSDIANNMIEMHVGLDENQQSTCENIFVRAMVILEGNNHAGTIHAGPPGRTVWDEDITSKRPSGAKSEYEIPQFNQTGNEFIQNAVKLMKKHFDDLFAEAERNLPDFIFYDNVIVKEVN